MNKIVRKNFVAVVVLCMVVSTLFINAFASDEGISVCGDYLVGSERSVFDEGAYNNNYFNVRLRGNGVQSWINLEHSVNTETLSTSLTVTRMTGLWHVVDQYTVRSLNKNAYESGSVWSDGLTYVAKDAAGKAYINGTEVSSLYISGWW